MAPGHRMHDDMSQQEIQESFPGLLALKLEDSDGADMLAPAGAAGEIVGSDRS